MTQKHHSPAWPTLPRILLVLTLFLAGGIGTELSVTAAKRTADQIVARETLGELNQLRSRIESELNSTLYLASGIEAQIRADKGQLRSDSINSTLALLQTRSPIIRNIGLAPGNRIAYVQPLKGNERALGLYYPENALQWPAINKVMTSRKPFLAGPVKLAQGGEGLIYRLPVFLDEDGRYWGMISTVLDPKALWDLVGLDVNNLKGIVILGKDAGGALGEPVLGVLPTQADETTFGLDIAVPGGRWRLQSTALAANDTNARIPLIRFGGWGITLILLAATIALLRTNTRLHSLNQNLSAATIAAEAGARAKSSFLAMMSHEIRTPMNGILGMTQLLKDSALSAQQADYAQSALESAESLLVILDDILDHSKIEAGQIQLEEVAFDLIDLMERIAEPFAARAQTKGLDFINQLDPNLPERVFGDPTRLRQILNNLLSNAVKFTADGRITLEVSREAAPSGRIVFCIRDTGIGIDKATQSQLFTPFVQADTSHARRFGGTGLGLTISRDLARLMGGDIHIDSSPGKGAAFICSLSLRTAASTANTAGSALKINLHGRDAAPRLYLICADPAHCSAITPWLQRLGSHASHAENSQAATAQIKAWINGSAQPTPDIFIVDQDMHECNSIIQTILNTPQFAHCKLIKLGGSTNATHSAHQASLRKPMRPSILARTISELLDPNRPAPEASPAMSEAEAEAALTPAPVSANDTPSTSPSPSTQARRRILLVEDHIINRKVALAALHSLDADVTCAENGQIAVDLLSQSHFDIVLMDMHMPVMDGPSATRIIRDESSSVLQHDIPIIALTANAFADHRTECLAIGMNDFISKPFDANALRRLITQHWDQQRPSETPEKTQ